MIITKKQLISNLRDREGMTWDQSKRIVNDLFNEIAGEVVKGNDVYIPKFGKFFLSVVGEKHCKHPETKEDITLPRHPIARFRMAEEFKRKLK